MDEMIKRIKPYAILVYGGEVEYDYKDIPVYYYENKVTKRMKNAKEKDIIGGRRQNHTIRGTPPNYKQARIFK